jgi:hypothetical protein
VKPNSDQIEVTTFGPGYGECSVIHLGSENWIVVDSCINSATGQPVALEYFHNIGVDPGKVRLVIATHWHDDHIRGMARQLDAFADARFCASSALTNKEFLATIISYNDRHGIVSGSGASEMSEVLEILRKRAGKTVPIRSMPARTVFVLDATASGHGQECRIITLSPSDKQFDKFLAQLGALVPLAKATKRRVPDQTLNDLSVVTLALIGQQAILLGADLEENGDPELGWSAIVRLSERPGQLACIFKIPHHGSSNAHCADVWEFLLQRHPLSVLTPWNRNAGLPTESDVRRIIQLTHGAFSTSNRVERLVRDRPYAVQKQIRETVGRLSAPDYRTGWVRFRNGGSRNPLTWCIELSQEACHLSEWKAA